MQAKHFTVSFVGRIFLHSLASHESFQRASWLHDHVVVELMTLQRAMSTEQLIEIELFVELMTLQRAI